MKNNTVYPSTLAARCAAQNIVNAEANRLSVLTILALTPFVGQKVIKTGGGLMEKVKAVLPSAIESVQKWLSGSDYVLRFALKTHEVTAGRRNALGSGDDYQIAHYAEMTFDVGELGHGSDAGVLVKLSGPTNYPTDHNPDKVFELRKLAETAKEAARNAESACYPFGLFDCN